jgi:hypothetical protein
MSPPLPSVCMIGAGSSGIAAAKERAAGAQRASAAGNALPVPPRAADAPRTAGARAGETVAA